MTTEDFNKVHEILSKFPGWEEKYNKSALFHQVVQMLVRQDDPYLVIDQLIKTTEDVQKAFEHYIITDTRPLTLFR